MAPANGSTGNNGTAAARKGPTTRHRNVNPVVPAIPLPYMQKRAQKQSISKGSAAPVSLPSSTTGANGDSQTTPKGVPLQHTQPGVSDPGISNEAKRSELMTQPAEIPAGSVQAATLLAHIVGIDNSSTTSDSTRADTQKPTPTMTDTASSRELVSTSGASSVSEKPAENHRKSSPREAIGQSGMLAPTTTLSIRASNPLSIVVSRDQAHPAPVTFRPDMMNALRRDSPAFQPGANVQESFTLPNSHNGSHPGPMMNTRPSHHPHASVSSITFGGLHDSNNSSPAPLSGGYGPPPGFPVPNGGSYMGRPSGPEFRPQPFVYGNNIDPTTTMDHYGQTMPAYAPHDGGYHPYMGNYMPATPHSFQGSQPSPQPEDNGMYGIPNGAHGHFDDGPARGPTSMYGMGPPPGMLPPMHPLHVVSQTLETDVEQLLEQVKRQFQDAKFSDCILELFFPDHRAPPLKFHAHRFVLAQSRTLEQLMLDSSTSRRKAHSGLLTVMVRADDRYLRSDAFMMAIQRLYGFPLFDIPPPPPGTEDLPLAGGAVDQFKFVISYAAAGHFLQYRSIVVRGMEMASRLVGWETVELALEFSLSSSTARGTIDFHEKWHYGSATNILYEAIVAFVANHLTTEFQLDFAVCDPEGYGRLPKVDAQKEQAGARSTSPAIARGSVMKLTPKHRSRLSKIKFGDMASEDVKPAQRNGNNGVSKRTTEQSGILSRILLNLPFDSVKTILESPRFGMDAENVAVRDEARFRLISDVLGERETRRQGALDAVKEGRIANADAVRRTLSSVQPRTTDECAVLGYQETVAPASNSGTPYISRVWVPLSSDQNGNLNESSGRLTASYP
ncbi:hypothetical protein jhhlp_001647 [Lomentospora prolificans]|uniref:BTB domain-containing protein n=1 Tax=Lomentospora prolificans TaxID=41688 RepID=A0A2N3NIS6_9PEZI|nr:hypothetical protein jhhlp_001647 [Lomentospora prolificans]